MLFEYSLMNRGLHHAHEVRFPIHAYILKIEYKASICAKLF